MENMFAVVSSRVHTYMYIHTYTYIPFYLCSGSLTLPSLWEIYPLGLLVSAAWETLWREYTQVLV